MLRGVLHRFVVEPNVREVKASEHTAGRGPPGDANLHRLAAESLFSFSGPDALGDEVLDAETFATTPDTRGGIKGQGFDDGLRFGVCFAFATCEDRSCAIFDVHFLELPDESFALAVAGLVFEQQNVVLSGCDAKRTCFRLLSVVHGQDGHGGRFRVRREKRTNMQHRSQWNVAQFGRCAVITHEGIRQQGKWMRRSETEDARGCHAKAAAPIRVIHEDEFAAIRVRFFQRRELAGFGPKCAWFLVLCSWCFVGSVSGDDE